MIGVIQWMEEFLQKLIGGFVKCLFLMVLTIQGDAGFRNHPPYHGIDYIPILVDSDIKSVLTDY